MRAKKSLGQHWLESSSAAQAIMAAARLAEAETVLEIGPGTGFLTEFLLAEGARVIAVEKDKRAVDFLRKKFEYEIKAGKLKLFHEDILHLETDKWADRYKVVANIPYYLTGQILRRFLGAEKPPALMVLMLQDEVARRIVVADGKESLISISVKAYGEPRYMQKVPAKFFSPAPKVDSAILLIDHISKKNFTGASKEKFFALVKRGFGSKRKMLRNHLGLPPAEFVRCKIEPSSRAENLTLEQWLCLAGQL